MSDLQPIEFYVAEFRRRFFSIKSLKSKTNHAVAIKVYVGEHRNFYGHGKTYQEALNSVYSQLLKDEQERKMLGPTHPAWEKDWKND